MLEAQEEPSAFPKSGIRVKLFDLGFSPDYKLVWDFQKKLLNERIEQRIEDCVIVVEHDHVITLGRSSHEENVLSKDLPIFEIERGGDATYHGPGQLVIYPIFSLQSRGLGVRNLVEVLESSIIQTLSSFGIEGASGLLGKETGVWLHDKKRKIASIGIAVSHWVSYHGVALNVNTDLSYFQRIRPCGYESSIMTSMRKELSVDDVDIDQVRKRFIQFFGDLTGSIFVSRSPNEV